MSFDPRVYPQIGSLAVIYSLNVTKFLRSKYLISVTKRPQIAALTMQRSGSKQEVQLGKLGYSQAYQNLSSLHDLRRPH